MLGQRARRNEKLVVVGQFAEWRGGGQGGLGTGAPGSLAWDPTPEEADLGMGLSEAFRGIFAGRSLRRRAQEEVNAGAGLSPSQRKVRPE